MALTLRRVQFPRTFPALCPLGAQPGDMVFISADYTGDYYVVDLCDITQPSKRAAGMVVTKHTATECTVQTEGEVTGLYNGLVPGLHLYLGVGAGGRLTHTPPGPPASGVHYLENAGFALGAERLYLRIQPAMIRIP